ncbi:hypothetical protein PQR75_40800 [Paraburkholderia fungorum]|uniref:hypothetical protein n=1 Tax=Paraburkholderia fungorum TaxID=134537 RepID=UPI0038B6EAA7
MNVTEKPAKPERSEQDCRIVVRCKREKRKMAKMNVLRATLGGIFFGGCATGLVYNISRATDGVFVVAGVLGLLAGATLIGVSFAAAK